MFDCFTLHSHANSHSVIHCRLSASVESSYRVSTWAASQRPIFSQASRAVPTAGFVPIAWPGQVEKIMYSTARIISVPISRQRACKLENRFLLKLISCLYLAWGQFSQRMIAEHVKQSDFVKNKPLLIMPTPFNSFYWRVLSYQKDNYYEAFTYLGNKDPLHWSEYSHNRFLLDESQPNDLPRLEWFSDGWLRFDDVNGKLQVTDLRLGVTGYHPFTFEVAHKAQSKWQTVEPLQIEMEIDDIKLQQLFTELKTKIGLTP